MYEENDEKISYLRLKRHIVNNHPTDLKGNSFGICEELGYLPCSNCCFPVRKNPKTGAQEIEVRRLHQQLGLGPTLFLMKTKTLAYLFLFLTILNLPVMAFYYSGNKKLQEGKNL